MFSSLQLPTLATGFACWQAVREFFAYHGAWAPGVRLLRRMGVRNKLLLVMAIVAAPMLPLTWMTIQSQNLLVVSTTQRLSELQMAGAMAEMVSALGTTALGAQMAAAADASPAVDAHTARVAASWLQLRQAYARAVDVGLPLQQAWERNQADLAQAVQGRALSAEARQESQRQAVEALLRLRRSLSEVVSGHASTDAEVDGTTTLALDLLPGLQIELGRLSVQLGQVAALSPQLAERDRYAQLLALSSRLERARYLAEKCTQRLQKDRTVNMAGGPAWADVQQFLERARAQLAQYDPAVPVQPLQAEYLLARERVQAQRLDQFARADQALQR
jgi:hypothetical protein